MLTQEELLFRLGRIKENTAILFCGMGEQLTHPQFYDFLELAGNHRIQLVTNGTIRIDMDRLTRAKNVQSITFSVDGHDEETAQKACSRYRFDILISNLEKLQEQKGIQISINFVISKDNVDYLFEMADFCNQYQVSALNLLLPTTDLKWVSNNYDRIHEVLSELRKYVEEKNYTMIVNLPDTMFCMYNGYIIPYISVEGYVRPCCSHNRGVRVDGQIQKNNMEEIMNDTPWKTFINEFDCDKCSMNQVRFSFE
jgi:MoaA/NifB/PqqE/SkfB family radical SAM enzyme